MDFKGPVNASLVFPIPVSMNEIRAQWFIGYISASVLHSYEAKSLWDFTTLKPNSGRVRNTSFTFVELCSYVLITQVSTDSYTQ